MASRGDNILQQLNHMEHEYWSGRYNAEWYADELKEIAHKATSLLADALADFDDSDKR